MSLPLPPRSSARQHPRRAWSFQAPGWLPVAQPLFASASLRSSRWCDDARRVRRCWLVGAPCGQRSCSSRRPACAKSPCTCSRRFQAGVVLVPFPHKQDARQQRNSPAFAEAVSLAQALRVEHGPMRFATQPARDTPAHGASACIRAHQLSPASEPRPRARFFGSAQLLPVVLAAAKGLVRRVDHDPTRLPRARCWLHDELAHPTQRLGAPSATAREGGVSATAPFHSQLDHIKLKHRRVYYPSSSPEFPSSSHPISAALVLRSALLFLELDVEALDMARACSICPCDTAVCTALPVVMPAKASKPVLSGNCFSAISLIARTPIALDLSIADSS
eukprot:6211826-Pleurochrysis_carterae.AAC.3